MKVIIVDDEPKAIQLIASYLTHFSNFELVNTFRNGLKALEYLNTHEVDIVFLDISMPHLSGLSLSKMISAKTAIVFSTAYSEHALESYEVNATDYLLKPISLERFSRAIAKLTERFDQSKTELQQAASSKSIFVKSGLTTHQLAIDTIDYLKKDGNYIYYFSGKSKIMARQSIAEVLELLTDDFIQVQKSFIVNFRKINSMTPEHVVIGETHIPLGLQYKQALMERVHT